MFKKKIDNFNVDKQEMKAQYQEPNDRDAYFQFWFIIVVSVILCVLIILYKHAFIYNQSSETIPVMGTVVECKEYRALLNDGFNGYEITVTVDGEEHTIIRNTFYAPRCEIPVFKVITHDTNNLSINDIDYQ